MWKICSKCYINKDNNEFRKDKKWLLWLRSICKICESIYMSERYKNKKEEINTKAREYYYKSDNTKELWRLRRAKRRSIIKTNTDNTITLKYIKELLEKQNYKCNYCWKDISEHKSRHLDHIYPLSKWWIHSIKNIQWLCCKCNLEKWNKIFDF